MTTDGQLGHGWTVILRRQSTRFVGVGATRYQMRQRMISMGDDYVSPWLHDALAGGGGS